MFKRFSLPCIVAVTGIALCLTGCATNTENNAKSAGSANATENNRPVLASAGPAGTTPLAPPTTAPADNTLATPSTRPTDIIAQLQTMPITRDRLDSLLYETYGLQMVFDLVELDLAKNTLLVKQNKVLEPADVQRERDIVFAGLFPDAQKPDYDGLFNQFLQKEKLKRAEFELRAIETSAVLRKIIEPMVIGNFSDAALRRGYQIMYGANRQIADITLANTADAEKARERVKTEPWDKVVSEMSIDSETKNNGGLWAGFSAQSTLVPKVIIETAFSMEIGQISDIISDGTNYHIIKVVNVIDPKAQKYDDVKDIVKKQMEDKLIEKDMKEVRQQLQLIAQEQIKFSDPVLKAQWDQILAKQQPASTDKKDVLKQMDQRQGPDLRPLAVPAH